MKPKFHFAFRWTLALLLVTTSGMAQSIRVTSWNLAGVQAAAGTNSLTIIDAAAALKLTGPDVILLQNVPDWKTCDYLVQSLKPAKYLVVACSSFREGTNRVGNRQVAILSRYKAYFSWSEPARDNANATSGAGFAFAGIRIAGQPLGFYSSAWPEGNSGEAFAQQLLAHTRSMQGWNTNKVEAAFLAGTFLADGSSLKESRDAALASLLEGKFGASDKIPATPVAAGDFIVSEPAGLALAVSASATRGFSHAFVTWDVDIAPSAVTAARAAFKASPAKTMAAARPGAPLPAPSPPSQVTSAPPTEVKPQGTQTQSIASTAAPAMSRTNAIATAPPSTAPQSLPKPAPSSPKSNVEPTSILMIGGGVIIFFGGVIILRRVLRRPRVAPTKLLSDVGATSYTVVVGTPSKTATAAEARPPQAARPVIHVDTAGATHTQAEMLRHRAEAAEPKSDRAQEAIRAGVIGNLSAWLKQKFIRRLLLDRDELMATQHAATMKVLAVEERLTKIEAQINLQNLGYQQRIDELTRELIAAKDENRELIRNQIRQVKAEMEAARERILAQSKEQGV